jgi:septum site-determining protein MinC
MNAIGTKEGSCFQLKADFVPITVLKLSQCDLQAISQELDVAIASAPKYFTHAPVIVDILNLGPLKNELNIPSLCKILRDKKIIPVGIRGLETKQKTIATDNGLAILKSAPSLKEEAPTDPVEIKNTVPNTEKAAQNLAQTKIITKPVRAGTRVYAKDGDLIILAAVNSGAEVIADGNIHIYGPLRGRALAGASGNKEARIFCKELEAELISIAGHYWVKENMFEPKSSKAMLQIYLENDKLKLDSL